MGKKADELAKTLQTRSDEVVRDGERLLGAANGIDGAADRLRRMVGDMGMRGAAADAADKAIDALALKFRRQADDLRTVKDVGDEAHVALLAAQEDYHNLPDGELSTGYQVAAIGAAGVVGYFVEKSYSEDREKAREAKAATALDNLAAALTAAAAKLPTTGSDLGSEYRVDIPPPVPPGPVEQQGGGPDGPGTAQPFTSAGVGGVVESDGVTGGWVSTGTSTSNPGGGSTFAPVTAEPQFTPWTGGSTGAGGSTSSDGQVTGYVPGVSSTSGSFAGAGAGAGGSGWGGSGGWGSAGGFGASGGAGGALGGGALAGGLVAGGAAAGAGAFGRLGGGAGGLLGGSGVGGLGAGGGSGLSGRAGASGLSAGSQSTAGAGAAGSRGSTTMGGMGAVGGGAGGGASSKSKRTGSGGYQAPKLDLPDDQAIPDLGPGARAGSRA